MMNGKFETASLDVGKSVLNTSEHPTADVLTWRQNIGEWFCIAVGFIWVLKSNSFQCDFEIILVLHTFYSSRCAFEWKTVTSHIMAGVLMHSWSWTALAL